MSAKVRKCGVDPAEGAKLLGAGHFYFANSFRLTDAPLGWTPAFTEYGGRFVSALERGNVLACQFHPELSGEAGRSLLERWLETATGLPTTANETGGASC